MRKMMRSFEICQQLREIDGGIDRIKGLLDNLIRDGVPFFGHIEKWAYIIHDRDVKSNGDLKEPHLHLMVKMKSPYPLDMISRSFGVEPQYVERIKGRWSSALAYLTHKNAPSKYQYSLDDVQCNFEKSELQELVADEVNPIKHPRLREILRGIFNGDYAEWNLHKFISGEEYTRWRKDIDNAFRYYDTQHESQNRIMDVVYIYGDSGSGKTSFAKEMFPEAYVSSQGRNPFDNYKGQPYIIIDDARFDGKDWSIADLCKLLDNNTASLVGARYYNKNLHRCQAIAITSVVPWNKFLHEKGKQFDEDAKQIDRRVGTVIEIKFRRYLQMKNAILVDVVLHKHGGRNCLQSVKKEIAFPEPDAVRVSIGKVLESVLGLSPNVSQPTMI